MGASIFVIAWSMVGFYMVLFIAAIKGIPADVTRLRVSMARGRFRTAISITVPMIRDTIRTAYIYLGILALDAFVYMQALNPSGGPANSTGHQPAPAQQTAFKKGKFGYATSMGAALAIITLVLPASSSSSSGGRSSGQMEGRRRHVGRRCARPGTGASGRAGAERAAQALLDRQDRRHGVACRAHRLGGHHLRAAALGADEFVQDTQQIFGSPSRCPPAFNFDNYVSAWTTANIGSYFFTPVIVVGGALIIVMLLGAMCAYYLARLRVQGQQDHLLPDARWPHLPDLPRRRAAVPDAARFGLLNTFPGLIITYVAFALPFTVFFLYAFFRTLPQEIAEAAQSSTVPAPWRIFFTIMLPMATPALPRWRSSTSSACGTSSCCPSRSTPTPPTTC